MARCHPCVGQEQCPIGDEAIGQNDLKGTKVEPNHISVVETRHSIDTSLKELKVKKIEPGWFLRILSESSALWARNA